MGSGVKVGGRVLDGKTTMMGPVILLLGVRLGVTLGGAVGVRRTG